MSKALPFTEEQIGQAVELYPTPFHIYVWRILPRKYNSYFDALSSE